MGYLKSHPATKQEAQLLTVEQSARIYSCTLPAALRDLVTKESALPVMGRASYCLAGERLLVGCYALESASDAKVPLDQRADLLGRQASVLWDGVQHLLERLKGRESVQKVFHKLPLLLPWDAYVLPSCAAGCPSVPSGYFQPEGAEGFPKGLVTELLHNGSYVLLTACAFDLQKLVQLREQKVRCDAPVPSAMLRYRYTSARNLPTNLCFHIVREEAVLPIQLLFQIRNHFLQAPFCESLFDPNFEFGSANLRLRRHTKHYDKHARKVSSRFLRFDK